MSNYSPSNTKHIDGAIWMILSALSFSIQLAILKLATHRLHPLEVLVLRNVFAAIPLGIAALFTPPSRPKGIALYILRAGLGVGASATLYTANSLAPLALVMLLFNARLFPMGLMASMFLGERISHQRWLYMLLGFAGIAIAIAPTMAGQSKALGVSLGIAAAILSASSQISVKKLTQNNGALSIALYSQLLLFLLSIPLAIPVWSPPQVSDIVMIAIAASFGGLAALSAAQALRLAPATIVSPIDYTAIIFSALLGYVMFSETPTWNTMVGALLIGVASFRIVKST